MIDKYRSSSVEPSNPPNGYLKLNSNHLNGSHRKIKYNHVDSSLIDHVGFKDNSPYTGEIRKPARLSIDGNHINDFNLNGSRMNALSESNI